MIKVLLSGCNGRMGQAITRIAKENENVDIVCGVDLNTAIKQDYPVYKTIGDFDGKVDVVIDFTNPNSLYGLIEYSLKTKTPLVVATTGLLVEQTEKIKNASKSVPIFYSANMSLGINLLIDLVQKAAKVLEGSFDIEIIEKHHNQKLDAPSGTALAIADAISEVIKNPCEYVYDRHSVRKKRSKNEIGILAMRGGTIVGDHSVIFAGLDEIIEINHIAQSREVFAVGAVKAAEFLIKQGPGLYNMKDLVNAL
jgi:4-hydroxy-tetrahydrodipicolinate reductase